MYVSVTWQVAWWVTQKWVANGNVIHNANQVWNELQFTTFQEKGKDEHTLLYMTELNTMLISMKRFIRIRLHLKKPGKMQKFSEREFPISFPHRVTTFWTLTSALYHFNLFFWYWCLSCQHSLINWITISIFWVLK